jgi:hypothetical protein
LRFWAAIAATLALVVAAPASGSSHGKPLGAHAAKKCKKKHGKKRCKKHKKTPTVAPPASVPVPLSASEVIDRVVQKAGDYCATADMGCIDYGYYYDTALEDPACSSKTTYSWSCYGWNQEYLSGPLIYGPLLCTFIEIVERDGYNGIKSHQDLSFGGVPWGAGWECEGNAG